jgi:hypothetical protein
VLIRREYGMPWWRLALAYAVLMLLLDRDLANPNTGALTRVLLPLTVGFNILLASEGPRPVSGRGSPPATHTSCSPRP